MKEEDVVILKIGGSSITDKAREETLNLPALDWFADLVARSVDPSFLAPSSDDDDDRSGAAASKDDEDGEKEKEKEKTKRRGPKFVVVHGAGSFGHHSAKRHGLRCGKAAFLEDTAASTTAADAGDDDDGDGPGQAAKRRKHDGDGAKTLDEVERRRQMEGLARTRRSVQKLNAATVDRLVERGVNAVGISPGVSFARLRAHGAAADATGGGRAGMRDLCQSIRGALDAGLLPVVHGDACLLYDGVRGGILGGDTIAEGLCSVWNCGRDGDDGDGDDGDGDDRDGDDRDGDDGETSGRGDAISRVIFVTDVAGVFTSDPKSDPDAELIRSLEVDGATGEVTPEDRANDGGDDDRGGETGGGGGANYGGLLDVGGSSHAHDVTGGLRAKLGAAVAIVRGGVEVIISECGSRSTERFVGGDWDSVRDVEAGTLLTLKFGE